MRRALAAYSLLGCLAACAWQVEKLPPVAGAADNVVADPSFEGNGWQAAAGACFVSGARTGKSAARIERSRDRDDPRVAARVGPVQPGPWRLSAWMRPRLPAIGDPNYGARLAVAWLDAQGRELGADRGVHLDGTCPVWQYRDARIEAPVGAAKAKLTFHFVGSVCGLCDIDDVALTPGPLREPRPAGAPSPLLARPTRRIFAPGEDVEVEVVLPKALPLPARLTASMHDSRGRALCQAEPIAIPAIKGPGRSRVCSPSDRLPCSEWLEVRVVLDAGQARWASAVGALVRPRPTEFAREADSPFALLNGHPYTMRWLGARWCRPNFHWHDREFELANRYGVTTLAMVNQATRALHGTMPTSEYARFVETSVRKYRGMVRWWQMGNEPPLFRPGMAEKYVAVLKAGYVAAKRADEDCIVAMGGLTGLNVDPDMLAKFLDAGGAQWCDVIDLHMYVPNAQMDALLAKARRDMAARRVDKPIILTEVTAALGKTLPEREKAAHVYKRYATALSHGVKQLYWFVMHWVNDLPGGFVHCGLMDVKTRAPWPAAAAYARLSDALTGAAFVRRRITDDHSWIFEFRKAGRSLWVAWAEQGEPRPVRFPCGTGHGRVIDVAGHECRVRVAGSVVVTLTDEPLLVELPSAVGETSPGNVRFVPARVTLSRGSAAGVRVVGPGAERAVHDAPPGLRVVGSEVHASAEARTGEAIVWSLVPGEEGTRAVLRLPAAISDPLSVDVRPLPGGMGKPARVRVRVTNHSARVQQGTLRLVSPLARGLRPAVLGRRFSELRPGEAGQVDLPLPVEPDPRGRYAFNVQATLDSGAAAQTASTLVFMPARPFVKPPVIDGRIDEWGDSFPMRVGTDTGERRDPKDGPPKGDSDLCARAALRWDRKALYLAVRVRDDVHRNDRADGAIWDGDGLQFGITSEPGLPDAPRAELGCALTAHGPQTWVWRALPRAPTGPVRFPAAMTRRDGETIYELAVPWTLLPGAAPKPHSWLGFALLVNEQDQADRGYYGWHAGVSHPKDPRRFGQVTLMEKPAAQ